MSALPYLHNQSSVRGEPLLQADAELLSPEATNRVERVLEARQQNVPTPLHSLSAQAGEWVLGTIDLVA